MPKLSNIRKLNFFIFFTMFAKYSVELFMPVILYKLNYGINQILIYLILTFIINILVSIPATRIGKRWGYKYLILISTFLFIALYFVVSLMPKNTFLFILVAFLSSITNSFYYLGRHYYTGITLQRNQMARNVGSILISTVLASIASSILSALMLDKMSMIFLAIIVTFIYLIGIFFVFKIPQKEKNIPLNLKYINQNINNNNKLFFVLEQFKVIYFTLYPLYVYIYVENTYSFLGLLYIVTGLASIIFISFLAHRLDNGKFNYLKLAAVLLSSILLLDMYITNEMLVLIIIFFEGIIIKLYETSVTNNMYKMRGDLDSSAYFLYMEILYNIARTVIVLLFLIMQLKMKTILIICIIFIFLSGFIKFKIKNIA